MIIKNITDVFVNFFLCPVEEYKESKWKYEEEDWQRRLLQAMSENWIMLVHRGHVTLIPSLLPSW